MTNKLTTGKTFWVLIIAAFTTGMGNGSVFGAAVMCAVGRGPFESWGGWNSEAYNPSTFAGFIDIMMFVFGLAFAIIVGMAMAKHGEIESQRDNTGW
ncbi:MAG: hypothetical protein OEX07_13725 [Gammaproteobacteria bacterium]|nr:hypothetical protein [Gammaproteobacteria bacterium]